MLHSTSSTFKTDPAVHSTSTNDNVWVKCDLDHPNDPLIKRESFSNEDNDINNNNNNNNNNDDDDGGGYNNHNDNSGMQFLDSSFFSQPIHAQTDTFPHRFRESVSSTSSSDSFAACTSPKSMSSATSHSSVAQSIQDYRWREPNHHEHKAVIDMNDISSMLEQHASSKMPIKDDSMMMLDAGGSSAIPAATTSTTTTASTNGTTAASPAALLIRQEQSINGQPLQIRILGVPDNGAKSRVETQIKLCIQLVTEYGTKVPLASHLRLPESMLARAKLRKSQTKKSNTPAAQSNKDPIIDLDAAVVCVSDPTRPVRMCAGCVRRERKRAERKKDCGPVTTGDEAFEQERDRVLIFNCDPLLNFSSSDAILPTRITCYCRHHNERVGFRIRFTMRLNGALIAKGETPPIMITDDHKSIKQPTNRKRRRVDDSIPAHTVPVTPASSRRGSMCTQSTDPSSLHHHPQQPQQLLQQQQRQQPLIEPTVPSHGPIFGLPEYNISSTTTTPLPTPAEEHTFNMFEDGNGLSLPAWPRNDAANTVSNELGQPFLSSLPASSSSSPFSGSLDTMTYRNSMMIPHPSAIPQPPPPQPQLSMSSAPEQQPQPQPRVSRLVPAQGPTYGGVEITILGSNFYRGLTCLFGDRPATTLCWSPSTLVCVLPPALQAGPVVVSFKEHPLLVEGTDVTLFHYYDANDQALLELALQVVGLKMTGKLHDAKQVAMGIVQGNQSNSNTEGKPVVVSSQQQQLQLQPQANDKSTTVLEERVVRALRATNVRDVSAVNATGHTLLHLAVMCCYRELVQVLLQLDAPVDAQDRNGLTPLHLACTKGYGAIADMLITASGGQTQAQSRFCDDMVIQSKRHQPSALLRRFHSLQNLMEARVSADDGVDDDEPNASLKKTQQMDQDGLGLQERHKLDKRLYLFWLPLLLGKHFVL
ncbi:hypothetical protein BCR43DRAFT_497727 [Syncephalastrum racemosum]|uniref:IPT/TIG domain-containing protein n=1 Tax=Syncephalastrum racemosum TaxID=13706 RepID=A0A1X2H2M5_SYNRA|nr:hypothetical protein BCR43DRAFT_497727 [Syncephalastrum racemosum]